MHIYDNNIDTWSAYYNIYIYIYIYIYTITSTISVIAENELVSFVVLIHSTSTNLVHGTGISNLLIS